MNAAIETEGLTKSYGKNRGILDVDLSLQKTAEAMLNLWPLCLFFGALAMLCSAVFHRRALTIAIPGAVLVGMYFLNALSYLVEEIEDRRPLSVFYHYGSATEEGIYWANFGGVTLATLLLVLLAVLPSPGATSTRSFRGETRTTLSLSERLPLRR